MDESASRTVGASSSETSVSVPGVDHPAAPAVDPSQPSGKSGKSTAQSTVQLTVPASSSPSQGQNEAKESPPMTPYTQSVPSIIQGVPTLDEIPTHSQPDPASKGLMPTDSAAVPLTVSTIAVPALDLYPGPVSTPISTVLPTDCLDQYPVSTLTVPNVDIFPRTVNLPVSTVLPMDSSGQFTAVSVPQHPISQALVPRGQSIPIFVDLDGVLVRPRLGMPRRSSSARTRAQYRRFASQRRRRKYFVSRLILNKVFGVWLALFQGLSLAAVP